MAHEADEPIFITKNGEGNMVVMSIAHFRRLQHRMEMLEKLHAAEAQRAQGDAGRPYNEVIREMREKLHERKSSR